jgi:hypothetical protein
MRIRTSLIVVTAVVLAAFATWAVRPAAQSPSKSAKAVTPEERLDVLARAQVWQPPSVRVARANLASPVGQPQSIACKFEITSPNGTSPKFDCTLDSGERIRVKYGWTPEIHSEIAAARLLHALGFPADDVALVENVRCFGCPRSPFLTMKAVDATHSKSLYRKLVDYDAYVDFEWALVERKAPWRAIVTDTVEGWSLHELDRIDSAKGGAPRAHVDALRLLAVFLAHWDNKSENQRLVCVSQDDWPAGGRCETPMAMLQDLGGDFGPRKVDFEGWRDAPIWGDRATCLATMASLPYEGATFEPVKVTEAGRRHLASLLQRLTDQQITELFAAARFDRKKSFGNARAHPVEEWVAVFKSRVRQISDGPPCPQ